MGRELPLDLLVVGAPSYLKRHGTPQKPEDLLRHECITFRSQTTGTLRCWARPRAWPRAVVAAWGLLGDLPRKRRFVCGDR
jgi:DNA-binding transcriptional LysR family regulator